jgi:hypothetical protein
MVNATLAPAVHKNSGFRRIVIALRPDSGLIQQLLSAPYQSDGTAVKLWQCCATSINADLTKPDKTDLLTVPPEGMDLMAPRRQAGFIRWRATAGHKLRNGWSRLKIASPTG